MVGSLQDDAWLLLERTMKAERSIGIGSESETGSGSELETGRAAMGLNMVGSWGYLY